MQETLALQAMESIKADDIAKFVDGAADETLDARTFTPMPITTATPRPQAVGLALTL
jgi:hypothetical protein